MLGKLTLKNPDKSKTLVADRASIVLPAAPIPMLPPSSAGNGDAAKALKGSIVKGFTTGITTVEAAISKRDEIVAFYRNRMKRGDATAAKELMERYPALAHDVELRSAVTRWIASGRMRRGTGRSMGSFEIHPLWVIGVVHELVSSSTVKDTDAAFVWLEVNRVMKYASAKDAYYTAQKDPRFEPFLVKIGRPVPLT